MSIELTSDERETLGASLTNLFAALVAEDHGLGVDAGVDLAEAAIYVTVEQMMLDRQADALYEAGTILLHKATAESSGTMTVRGSAIWDAACWLREKAADELGTTA